MASPDAPGSTVTPAPPLRQPNNVRGALLLTLSMLVLTLEAGIIRWVGTEANVSQSVFFRSAAQFIVVGCWVAWKGIWPDMRSRRLALHLTRGLLSVSTWWLYYRMFQKLDVALATVLTFSSSLFVVVLAGPLMGERVRAVSWIATFLGFAGIAIASGVGTSTVSIEVVLGLVASAVSALLVFLNRSLAQTEETVTIMTFIGLCVFSVALPLAYLNWQPLAMGTIAILMAAGIFGALGMVFSIEAYAVGETAVLAPIFYVRIAFAMAFGYLVFAEIPSLATAIGASIVIASALWALRVEQQRVART